MLLLVGLMPAHAPAAAALFESDEVLEVRLSGPLGTISRERQQEERTQYPFVLSVNDTEIPLAVRVRGKSRTGVCPFPPLRLNFKTGAADGTPFAGQNKLKLVTHCRSDQSHYENNTLEEYTAYRIFNLLSEVSYRVRLLRIHYEDTDDRLRNLDRPYFAFVIESAKGLAARVGGSIEEIPAVLYSQLDVEQTARLNVFQYLIGNVDWSFVSHLDEEMCCHNLDLFRVEDSVYPVPFDFDLSGLVNANYAQPTNRQRKVTTRVYGGYCRSSIESVAEAVDDIAALRDEILAIVETSPVVGREDVKSRMRYLDDFLEEAVEKRDKVVRKLERTCIGRP